MCSFVLLQEILNLLRKEPFNPEKALKYPLLLVFILLVSVNLLKKNINILKLLFIDLIDFIVFLR